MFTGTFLHFSFSTEITLSINTFNIRNLLKITAVLLEKKNGFLPFILIQNAAEIQKLAKL